MPINAVPVTVMDITGALSAGTNLTATFGGAENTLPVALGEAGLGAVVRGLGSGSDRTNPGKRAILQITRADTGAAGTLDGATFAVYGVDLPDALSGKPKGNSYAAAQTETVVVFKNASAIALSGSATFDASALGTAAIGADSTGYNWLVVVNGVILPYAAAALANNLSWSISAGVVTLRAGTASATVAAGSDIVVYKIAAADVREILAGSSHVVENAGVYCRSIYWTRWTDDQAANDRTVVTVIPAVGA